MKILVTAKRVVDYNVNIRVLADQSGVDLNNVKMSVIRLMKSRSKKRFD